MKFSQTQTTIYSGREVIFEVIKYSPILVKLSMIHQNIHKKNHLNWWKKLIKKGTTFWGKMITNFSDILSDSPKNSRKKSPKLVKKYSLKNSGKIGNKPITKNSENLSESTKNSTKMSPKLVKIGWIHQDLHKFCRKSRWAPIWCCMRRNFGCQCLPIISLILADHTVCQ